MFNYSLRVTCAHDANTWEDVALVLTYSEHRKANVRAQVTCSAEPGNINVAEHHRSEGLMHLVKRRKRGEGWGVRWGVPP